MSDQATQRALELIVRELEADDAHLEYGGRDPVDARAVAVDLPKGWRLVAVFSAPPERPKEVLLKLRQLAAAFFEGGPQLPFVHPRGAEHWTTRRLDDELCLLAARVNAIGAVVIDAQSPVVWGYSEPRLGDESVDDALAWQDWERSLEAAGLSLVGLTRGAETALEEELSAREVSREVRHIALRAHAYLQTVPENSRLARVLLYRAAAELSKSLGGEGPKLSGLRRVQRQETFGYVARSFANIYVGALVFDREYSELHAEASLLHALPVIERLVLSLPPFDPPPKGGRILKFPAPGREP